MNLILDKTALTLDDVREVISDSRILDLLDDHIGTRVEVLDLVNDMELSEVEEIAHRYQCGGFYRDERHVSKTFDRHLEESQFFDHYDRDDIIAINEAFSIYVDGLNNDNYLFDQQVDSYCYVGKYSDER
jgi:hypothetical protein